MATHLYLKNKIKEPYWQALFAFWIAIFSLILAGASFMFHCNFLGYFFSMLFILSTLICTWHHASKSIAIRRRQLEEEERALVL